MIIPFGPRSSNQFEFFRYLCSFPKECFFNCVGTLRLFDEQSLPVFLRIIAENPLNSKPFTFLWFLLPFFNINWFNFRFVNSAPYGESNIWDLKSFFSAESRTYSSIASLLTLFQLNQTTTNSVVGLQSLKKMLLTFEVHTGANKLTLYGLFEGLWDGGALHHVLGTEVGELNPLQQQIRDALRIENN